MGFNKVNYLKHESNKIADAVLLADSEDAAFPVENIQDLPVARPFKSDGVVSSVKIRFDFGGAELLNIFALVGHNLTSAATITIKGGSSADPDGSQFTTTVTWRRRCAWKIFSSNQTWRYWSVTLADAANPDGLLAVGYMIAGAKTEISAGVEIEWDVVKLKTVRKVENEIGGPIVGALMGDRRELTLGWPGLTTEEATIDAFLDDLDKEIKPLLIVPAAEGVHGLFGRLCVDYGIRYAQGSSSIVGVRFLEDPAGNLVIATQGFLTTDQLPPGFRFVFTTGTLNGSNKVFTLPTTPSSDYPIVLIGGFGSLLENSNGFQFTRSGAALTLGANVPAPISGDPQPVAMYCDA